ncbi:serine hydrolase domain-containing protein [Micromonospora carbonacea]|uniref:serine hydrolase domain-containing protein n=1 Tax=Micromonospora carbonacea TaxID=47853 RepID=UPI003D732115
MTDRHADLQAKIHATVDELVSTGREAGVQITAYLHGHPIVEVHAGVADTTTGRPMTAATPVYGVSTGKGLTATVVHVLAERGHLDYDLRIADVWPEFARHGKGHITLRHALTHTAGIPALPADVTLDDFADWDHMCAIVADARPLWTPGRQLAYHAWTFGWIVGEVVRRVTGRRVGDILTDDVAAPLGVTGELFCGVDTTRQPGPARMEDGNLSAMLETFAGQLPHLDRVAPPGVRPDATLAARPDVIAVDVPAVGTLTARAAARMYAALLGPVDGVRLISPHRLRAVSRPAVRGTEWVFGRETTWGLGYAIDDDGSFGVAGSGGSLAFAYPRWGLTVAATRNRLAVGDGDPLERLRARIRDTVAAAAD